MTDTDAIALFKRQQQQLEDAGWAGFKTNRDDIDDVIFRRKTIAEDDDMPKLSVLSTQAERGLHQAVDILKMNPTKLDTISLDQGKQAKDDVEDIRIWDGTFWHKQNDKRRLDTARARNLYGRGVAVERLFWDMPGEYDGEEPDDDTPAEEAAEMKNASAADREAYFKGLNSDHWLIQPVNPKSCMWLPVNEEPDLFFEVSEISYAEATNLKNQDGEYFSLDGQKKIRFLGERAPLSDQGSNEHRIKVTTRAMKDKDTGKWTVANFVEVSGTDEAVQLDEVEVPFSRCPYFIIPSGDLLETETDPNLRYRVPIFPLVEAVNRKNFHVTQYTRLVLKYADNFYADISKATPEQATAWDVIAPVEGQGAQRSAVIEIVKAGANELPMHLHVERYPFELDSVSEWVLNDIEKDIQAAMPSRYVTGDVSRTEATNETATTMVNLSEQSALPWESHLANMDGYGTKAEIEAVHECILYWDQDAKGGTAKPYYTVSSGEEPLLKGAPESGTQVYIDANKLKRPFQLVVQTANKTQTERQADLIMTMQLKAQGMITEEQALGGKTWPFDDPRRQMELIEEDQQRKDAIPGKRQLITKMRYDLMTALLGAPPPIQPQQQAGTPLPPGQAQIGAPGQQETPQPPAPPNPGAQVLPAPVTMQGGSSGSTGAGP